MFSYNRPLFYPVHVQLRDPVFGQILLEHYGGKDSEYSAATQYLNHRSNMHNRYLRDLLGLIAAEEMGHMEMIAVAINKLGGAPLNYVNSQGIPWNMGYIDQNSDPIAMLQADVEAEVRAKKLYDQHLKMTNDSGLQSMIKFLGNREDVHRHLFHKAQILILQGVPHKQYIELISEYKASLQTID